jgi:hypothetical protein
MAVHGVSEGGGSMRRRSIQFDSPGCGTVSNQELVQPHKVLLQQNQGGCAIVLLLYCSGGRAM